MGIPPIPLSKNCCQRLSVKAGNLIDTTTKPSLCEPSLCCDAVSITPPPEKLLAPATTVKITLRDLKINPRLSQLIKHELGLPISLPIDQFIPLNGFDAAYSENQAPLYGKGAPINSAKKVKDPQKAKEYAYKIARKLGFSREAIRKMPPSQLALLCFRIIAGQLEYDFPAYDRYKQTGQIAIPQDEMDVMVLLKHKKGVCRNYTVAFRALFNLLKEDIPQLENVYVREIAISGSSDSHSIISLFFARHDGGRLTIVASVLDPTSADTKRSIEYLDALVRGDALHYSVQVKAEEISKLFKTDQIDYYDLIALTNLIGDAKSKQAFVDDLTKAGIVFDESALVLLIENEKTMLLQLIQINTFLRSIPNSPIKKILTPKNLNGPNGWKFRHIQGR